MNLPLLLVVIGAAMSGGNYGVTVKGKLIPEVLKHGAIELGRFEVTRAQYVAWDNGYRIAKGTENFPANGISPREAAGYCEWLSTLTGETWRLPNENEVTSLYAPPTAGDGQLKEVGTSLAKLGFYDLDGNVREWVIAKDGKAKTLGGSAERSGNDDPMFTGFRVVRGKP